MFLTAIRGCPTPPFLSLQASNGRIAIPVFSGIFKGLLRNFVPRNDIIGQPHKERIVKKYLKEIDQIFGMIKKAIEKKKIYKLLEGPVADQEFRRLT